MGQGSGKYGLPGKKDFDRWSVGLTFGNTFLFGDILEDPDQENNVLKKIPFSPAFGFQVTNQLSHSVGIRLSGTYGKFLAGPNKERIGKTPIYYAELESPVIEGALEGMYTFGNISHLKRNKKFHLYVTLGVGVFNFDSEVVGKVDTIPGASDTTLTESNTQFILPMSIGFKYQIKKFDIGLSYDYRVTVTDQVDIVENRLSEYDNYAFLKLNVNYTLGKKNKAMEWVNPMEVVYNDIADLKDKVDILSGDKDKDGVSDMFDKDNSTAEGTKVYGDGTSVDTDGDGIIDAKDGDPFSLKNAKVDANGVEIDTDGDGVPDSRDLEPGTEKGKLVNFQGIMLEREEKTTNNIVAFLPSVFFDVNSSEIKQVYKDRILVVARAMKSNPELKITVTGNTDLTAGDEYNDKLGLKRAEAVKNHLVKVYGIDAARITTESKGEKDPLADKTHKTMNRRVDFAVSAESK